MATQDNINDLMNAAKLKLEAQQREAEGNSQSSSNLTQDIYADMINEMNEHEDNQNINSVSHLPPNYGDDNISIEHNFVDESEIEINKNDVPIFENGPGMSQVELWKKQYTQEKVFHVQIIDRDFIFRTLNRFEYKQIVAIENIDALYREELICKTCVLFPYNYDIKTMAAEDSGYPSTLAQIIMENSGFTKEYGIEVL